MKIFITGSTGFIGKNFLSHCIANDHTVAALCRNYKPSFCRHSSVDWIDCSDFTSLTTAFATCDLFVHLMSHSVIYPYDSLSACINTNLVYSLDLLDMARVHGINNFIIIGSCFEYGLSGNHYDFIPTDAPLNPTNSYAASKAAASISFLQWAREHSLNLHLLRPFHIYGPGENPSRLWPSLKHASLSKKDFKMTLGEQVRDFLYVDDLSKIILRQANILYSSPSNNVSTYNVSSGVPLTIAEFASYWWHHWDSAGSLLLGALEYRSNEVMRYVAGPNLLTPHR